VPEAELADAKRSYASSFDSQLADDDFVVSELNQGLYLGRTLEFWRGVNAKIQQLTAAELIGVARKYLQPEKLTKIKAGDFRTKP